MTTPLNAIWATLDTRPRQLRQLDPAGLTLEEAEALAVHAWLGAPPGWKGRVLARLADLLA
jgi:hypothetical protein